MVDIPSFHDGHLTSITLADRRATLGFTRSDGRTYQLFLVDLEALQVNDFRQGNIVLALDVISGSKPSGPDFSELMERLFPAPHAKAEQKYHDTHIEFLARQIAKLESGNASLVSMSSSYGADLVAFCTAVEILELSETAG